MTISPEVRRLENKWRQGNGWPKRLESLEIVNLRGWADQRFDVRFPIMAITGENGAGKSTILQCAASVYRPEGDERERYASDYFPATAWDRVSGAEIGYEVREGETTRRGRVRRPTERWRGNRERRERHVRYIDLSRVQPVPARLGFIKLANPNYVETDSAEFERALLGRMSEIMGRDYDLAKMATLDADATRRIPVLSYRGSEYSGFHQGAGETTIAELLEHEFPKYSLILIDEIESSLHPRAQRRLIRDLAERCRVLESQIILTTHSPYVLEELPLDARAYIVQNALGSREIMYGVSPEFAMTKMDDTPHHECELYVEDDRAQRMLTEILAARAPELVARCRIIPFGAASVGQALGEMVAGNRFPRPSCVFLDGDQSSAPGCLLLPGEDAPERVVFEALRSAGWAGLDARLGRPYTDVADACISAMTAGDHHEWVRGAALQLATDSVTVWQAMAAEWATRHLTDEEADSVIQPIRDLLEGIDTPLRAPKHSSEPVVEAAPATEPDSPTAPTPGSQTIETERLF